ncbi:MAG: hypothetical protein LW865_01745 [Betaproteobacteria bacterium]|jgi:hypothetical protein|nr:hypothetical protein [Betaproteobacteria bacterium]
MQTFTIDAPQELRFSIVDSRVNENVPWAEFSQLKEHLLKLEKQAFLGELACWFSALPSLVDMTVGLSVEHEYNDEGGTYECYNLSVTANFSQPPNCKFDWQGVEVDLTDAADSDELNSLIEDAFRDQEVGFQTALRSLLNDNKNAKFTCKREVIEKHIKGDHIHLAGLLADVEAGLTH